MAPGLHGERRAVIAGIVLGEDEGLSDESARELPRVRALPPARGLRSERGADRGRRDPARLPDRTLALRRTARWRSRRSAATCSRSAGSRPSSGPASRARSPRSPGLPRRPSDRWYFLLLGAALLLAWSPYSLLDAGFQLSFAAVGGDLRRRPAAPADARRATRSRTRSPRWSRSPGRAGSRRRRSCSRSSESSRCTRFRRTRSRPRSSRRCSGSRSSRRSWLRSRRRSRPCSPGSTAGWPRTSPRARGWSAGCRTQPFPLGLRS